LQEAEVIPVFIVVVSDSFNPILDSLLSALSFRLLRRNLFCYKKHLVS